MTALAQDRMRYQDKFKHRIYTLTSGTKGYKGGSCLLVLGTGKVIPGTNRPDAIRIGVFDETVDATAADSPIKVDHEREVEVEFFVNATSTDAIAATDIGKDAYVVDDQTVGIGAAGRTVAGRIWYLDAKRGVAIEKITDSLGLAPQLATASFTSNDWAPASILNGGLYDVPTTGAASTITLPAAAPDGTIAYFSADGTKNSSTVQYRDATGPTNITTALTAAKRHLVVVAKRGGIWVANAYVSP